MKNSNTGRLGFTLIELLVVVLIIGILAAVALPQYQRAVDKTKITNMAALAETIAKAQEVYYLANGAYANSIDQLDISLDQLPYTIQLRSQNLDRLYLFGDDYLPGILLIAFYAHNTETGYQKNYRKCYADQTNTRAQNACKNLCKAKNLAADGLWKGCDFTGRLN